MLLNLLPLFCLLASSFAWLPPERCAQNKKSRRSTTDGNDIIIARSVTNIGQISEEQNKGLLETYQNHRFLGVPVRAKAITTHFDSVMNNDEPEDVEIHAPYNCSFYTHTPRLLSSVSCTNGVSCKLSRAVSLVDSYTASEGYNWGVKISTKFSIQKVFEVGGEVSTGGTYSCTYTKGRTTTDTVECSDTSGQSGTLQLYNVRSDMECDFGEIKLVRDRRGPEDTQSIQFWGPSNNFSTEEIKELKASAQAFLEPSKWFLLDTDKISDYLLKKLIEKATYYIPYSDVILVNDDFTVVSVIYLKRGAADKKYRRVVPFTNENGDSVYQYACTKA